MPISIGTTKHESPFRCSLLAMEVGIRSGSCAQSEEIPPCPLFQRGARGDFETRSLACTLYFFERNLVLDLYLVVVLPKSVVRPRPQPLNSSSFVMFWFTHMSARAIMLLGTYTRSFRISR